MPQPIDAENMDSFVIERIPAASGEAQQVFKVGRKKRHVNTAAVRITVTGVDGAVISDVWTRDKFCDFFRQANQVIADD